MAVHDNIFCMKDLSDIPDILREQLLLNSGKWVKILDIFKDAGRPLDINEVMIALWRKHKIILTRTRINAILHNYCRGHKPPLKRTKHKGQFNLT